jgi:hypothetical protein
VFRRNPESFKSDREPECPLSVISGYRLSSHHVRSTGKRTWFSAIVMSVKGQKRTHALQQNKLYSITSSAVAIRPDGIVRRNVGGFEIEGHCVTCRPLDGRTPNKRKGRPSRPAATREPPGCHRGRPAFARDTYHLRSIHCRSMVTPVRPFGVTRVTGGAPAKR